MPTGAAAVAERDGRRSPAFGSRRGATRSCGTCTVCCRVLEIAALAKPAGVLCRHNTGTGCGIYPIRPAACASWTCLWLKIPALPDALRPDRSGVLFSLEALAPQAASPEGACIVGRVVGRERRGQRLAAEAAFAMFVREGSLPVWRVDGRYAIQLLPDDADDDPG